MQPTRHSANRSEHRWSWPSTMLLGGVGSAILAAVLMSSPIVRAAEIVKAPNIAETTNAGGANDSLPGTETIAEGRSIMNEIFKRRHSIRSFQSRKLKRQDLEAILAAADSAPSAGGLKAREMLLVADDATKKRLVEAAHGQQFVAEAPVVIVFWAVPSRSAIKYGARGRDLFALQDATIAASFAWLQAVASGLAGCWVGAFDDEMVNKIFRDKIEADWRPIALLPVGYAVD